MSIAANMFQILTKIQIVIFPKSFSNVDTKLRSGFKINQFLGTKIILNI